MLKQAFSNDIYIEKQTHEIMQRIKRFDGKLYLDAELTEQAPAAAVAEAFDKNVLVVKVGDVSFKPVKFDTDTVTVVDVSSGTVTAVEFEALAE